MFLCGGSCMCVAVVVCHCSGFTWRYWSYMQSLRAFNDGTKAYLIVCHISIFKFSSSFMTYTPSWQPECLNITIHYLSILWLLRCQNMHILALYITTTQCKLQYVQAVFVQVLLGKRQPVQVTEGNHHNRRKSVCVGWLSCSGTSRCSDCDAGIQF